ncbi:MAG: DUF4115 domain-containing protein [Proteobacteria bacterium]|nr:DUF4115 domain-containing protein [Pseudomonadota bacterium]
MTSSHLREVSADGEILPGDVAAELYVARLQRGVDLNDVSTELRIHYKYLLAIEEGRYADLPGPAYVIGFLRSYAAYLGLDAADLVRRFKTETTEFDARQDLNALEPYDEGGVPTGALIALALALIVGAYAGWYYVANPDEVAIERIPEVPERMVAALESGTLISPEPVTEAPAAVENAVESAPAPRPTEPLVAEAEPVARESRAFEPDIVLSGEPFEAILAAAIEQNPVEEITAEPADAPTPAAPLSIEQSALEELESASVQPAIPAPVVEASDYLPRVFGQANAGSAITVRAREESWVQVTGDNNELLLTRILRPGDIYHVPDREGLMLMTGNAGGIEILVGDILAPPLGKIGKVRRRVALDPVRLLAGTAIDP